jgi:hypothetical protein
LLKRIYDPTNANEDYEDFSMIGRQAFFAETLLQETHGGDAEVAFERFQTFRDDQLLDSHRRAEANYRLAFWVTSEPDDSNSDVVDVDQVLKEICENPHVAPRTRQLAQSWLRFR